MPIEPTTTAAKTMATMSRGKCFLAGGVVLALEATTTLSKMGAAGKGGRGGSGGSVGVGKAEFILVFK